jgi:cellulose synthase/poly-beta-1,6-N-acetylglucosamine synthase-like glycosyltransferase
MIELAMNEVPGIAHGETLQMVGSHSKISIGICAYNEEENIHKLLQNLLTKQRLFQDTKIIVDCSGSTDRTLEIVKRYSGSRFPVKLIFEEKRRGKAHALNKIFKETNLGCGDDDPLVLVNGDDLPEPGSIDRLLQPFRDPAVGATTGHPVPINNSEDICSSIVHLIWDLHHRMNSRGDVKMSGELCAIRPELVKGIPVNLATDEPYIEMMIRQKGYRVVYVPDAIVKMKGPDNLRELFNQRRRICVGHAQIKALTGFAVSTFDVRNLPFLLSESIRMGLTTKKLSSLIIAALVETVARLSAYFDLFKGKIPYMWERLPSTKNLSPGKNAF